MPRNKLKNIELENMAQATIKGRASGAGTGAPVDLTAAEVSAIIGSSGGGITQLTGDVTAGPGSGSQAATIANKVTMTATTPMQISGAPTVIAGSAVAISIPAATASDPGYATAAQITKLDGIEAGANNYVHPTTAGNIHIPTGGATTQLLQWTSSGTAKWITISGDGSLADGGTLAINKTRLNIRNESGAGIATTKAVYITGYNSDRPLIGLADNTDEARHNVMGITVGAIGNSSNGYIATSGQCDAETNAWPVGTELYLSTSGALTPTEPTAGSVQHVGIVTVQQNYPDGKLLIYLQPEGNVVGAGTGQGVTIRLGDTSAATKLSVRDSANVEVASIDSDGKATLVKVNGNTITTGTGTLSLGSYTLTVPATGTAALLEAANAFTATQTITNVSANANAISLVISQSSTLIGYAQGILIRNSNATNGNYTAITNLDSRGGVANGNSWIEFINVDHTSPKGAMAFTTRNGSNYLRKMYIDENGNVGIGVNVPAGKIHGCGSNNIGSFMHWDKGSLDGTPQTIIPDGVGDVTVACNIFGILTRNGGNPMSINVVVGNSGTANLFADGSNTLQAAVSAAGALTVSRTLGASTFAISVFILWM